MSAEVAAPITAKQAAKVAIDFVEGFYQELGQSLQDVLLEEIEPSSDGNTWQITVGFSRLGRTNPGSSLIPEVLLPRFERTRQYKVVRVDRATGEIHSMKIRKAEFE